jgi:hypothetical protein
VGDLASVVAGVDSALLEAQDVDEEPDGGGSVAVGQARPRAGELVMPLASAGLG